MAEPVHEQHAGRGRQVCSNRTDVHDRGERSQTSTTDPNVPARLPLEIALTGVEQWIGGAIA